MVKRKTTAALSLVLVCLLSLLFTTTVYGHAATAESVGGTLVKFSYSDGTVINGARILVYDASGEQIGKGKTDKEGIFDYAEYAGQAASLYMNDGEGHAVTYEIPADDQAEAAEEAAAGSAETSAGETAEASAEKSAAGSAEASAEESAEGSAEASAEETVEGSAEAPAGETVEGSAETPAEETVEGSAEVPAETAGSAEEAEQSSGMSAGTIAALVIVLAAVIAVVVLILKRRNKNQ